ncbi:hypothetical protein BCR36DRAFT_404208 [Piromyces finnis]|uniref:Uncharacterized protein n=1 Tax=Piromyces finnis TaxID=1754191 RepID=A0A1Y1VB01_9FUNG|nr:hypothetical protein BCR36DRAFT_404208 [Piromyces finnis]|eukprot:ORX51061.1 hypothetical protein BCR36DRAFT_404208 [Piromyces finnis]
MVWNQMSDKEKKIYFTYFNECNANDQRNVCDPFKKNIKENSYNYNYNAYYQYSAITSPKYSQRNSISSKSNNLSFSKKDNLKPSYNSIKKDVQNDNEDNEYDNLLEPKPNLSSLKNKNKDAKTYEEYNNKEKGDDYHYTSLSTKHSIYIERKNITKYDHRNNKFDQQTEINIHRKNSKEKTIVKSRDKNLLTMDNLNSSINSFNGPDNSFNIKSPISDYFTENKNRKSNNKDSNMPCQNSKNNEDINNENKNRDIKNYVNEDDDDFLSEVEPYLMELYSHDPSFSEDLNNNETHDNNNFSINDKIHKENEKEVYQKETKENLKQPTTDDKKRNDTEIYQKETKENLKQPTTDDKKRNDTKENSTNPIDNQNEIKKENKNMEINNEIKYKYRSSYFNKTMLIKQPTFNSKYSPDDTFLSSSLDQKPLTTDEKYDKDNTKNETSDSKKYDKNLNEKKEETEKKKELSTEDLEEAYNNFCLLIVDIESIDYIEMSYFPQKKTTFYKIECPYFSYEDEKSSDTKEENNFNKEEKINEKSMHNYYDNFNSIYPSMSTKKENMGYEPFTGNQIQNDSFIFDTNEPMSKISNNQTIYKKVYWIKKKD